MRRLIFISLAFFGFASCDNKIENGDLVYLSQRDNKHLSLRADKLFKCSNEEKEPLVYVQIDNKTFSLKTQEDLNVYFKYYYLRVGEEEADIFTKEKIDDKIYLISPELKYVGCNGKEAFQVSKPKITINKY